MPRRPRVHDPEGFYHIVVRGDNRERVFVDECDRQDYLRLLHQLKRELGFECHAFALMTNHIHLLIRPGSRTTTSQLMQQISGRYTQYFNRRHARVGHLYQGRFYSSLVDRDGYFLESVRYIHLNPVRAGMVRHPSEYPWTSYRAYIDPRENPLDLVDTAFVLDVIDTNSSTQRHSFQVFLELGLRTLVGPHSVDLGGLVERDGILVPRRGRPKMAFGKKGSDPFRP